MPEIPSGPAPVDVSGVPTGYPDVPRSILKQKE